MATQPPPPGVLQKQCFHCGRANPDQAFCGSCGSPLALSEYISTRVKTQLVDTIRDRNVLEMDSSIKVFTKAWEWMRLLVGIGAAVLVLAGLGVFWQFSDLRSRVNNVKQSVADTAKKSNDDIMAVSSKTKQDITTAADSAKKEITITSGQAVQQSQSMKESALKSKTEISKETASFRSDLEGSRQQLQAASKLQPEIESIRQQLGQATTDIQKQQKVISSSEEFVKSVFASHQVEIFTIGQPSKDRYGISAPTPTGTVIVFLLLRATPIQNTIQLQYHVFAQQPNTYFVIAHNLLVFLWGEPAANLTGKQISVSYFPDRSDKELIHSISEHDGRWYADDQPLPKIGQPDPDFKGNKWMPLSNPTKP